MPAKRAYGMDQDFYPWSPIVTRPVLRWPDNARVALAVIVNLEHWDWEVPAGTPVAVSPMGGPEGIWTGNQPPISGNCGWLPVQIPSGPPIGLTATGVPAGTSQSQCSKLAMIVSATRALSGHWRTGRATIGDHG